MNKKIKKIYVFKGRATSPNEKIYIFDLNILDVYIKEEIQP